jgi:cytochrome P450
MEPRYSIPDGPGGPAAAHAAQFFFRGEPFLEKARRTYGDTFTLKIPGGGSIVVTGDPAVVKQVFTGDPDILYAGQSNAILGPLLGDKSLLLLDGAPHMRHRKLMLPPFHGERMRSYGEAMTEIAERQIARWPVRREFPVQRSMQDITLEIILRTVFGLTDPDRIRRLAVPMRRLLGLADGLSGGLRFTTAMVAGAIARRPVGMAGKLESSMREVDAILMAEVHERRSAAEAAADDDAGGAERDDILSLLLAARDEDGAPMTDQELRDELMTLVVAGHETTATALSWTVERVTRQPEVLERFQSETGAGREAYVDAVAKEALRMRPVVGGVGRVLQAPMEVAGHRLAAGTVVAPSIILVHTRPDIYPQPHVFRPERFLGERTPSTYEWIPFGGGVRRCIGASFALFEMRAVLLAMAEHVRLAPSAGTPEKARRKLVTLVPSRGGRMQVAARLQAA